MFAPPRDPAHQHASGRGVGAARGPADQDFICYSKFSLNCIHTFIHELAREAPVGVARCYDTPSASVVNSVSTRATSRGKTKNNSKAVNCVNMPRRRRLATTAGHVVSTRSLYAGPIIGAPRATAHQAPPQ